MYYHYTYLCVIFIFSSVGYASKEINDSTFQHRIFKNKIHYIISWNSLSFETCDIIRMFLKNEIKTYELIRSFWHCSWMRIKWLNSRYGYSFSVNGFEQIFTKYNLINQSNDINDQSGFIGFVSGLGGLIASYNRNGGLYKDTVNIGCLFFLGLLLSRPYLLKSENVSNLLKSPKKLFNFDIVCHISPIYIQFKDWFFFSVNYKFGIIDLIITINKAKNLQNFDHLLSGISINLGIY